MRRRALLALVCVAGLSAFAGADRLFRRLTVQLDFDDLTVGNRAQRLADVRQSGAESVQLAVCEFFPDGEKRRRELAKLKDMIAYFETAGYPVAVWTSSLGYGESTNPDLLRRFPNRRKITAFDGRAAVVCSTDGPYGEALAENTRDFIRAGARFILWDDDLVQGCRPGMGCVCEAHLRLVAERLGRPVTVAEIRDSFTGASNVVRTAFLDAMGQSLRDLCVRLRAAADSVDPTVGMGICASYTHYDLDGVDMADIVRVLAAKGQARPVLRVSGAPYWVSAGMCPPRYRKFPALDLGGVIEFVRTQTARYRKSDILLMDENDPYPRRHDKVPAGMCELYDKAMIAEDGISRNKYILRYGIDRCDTAYLDAHLAHAAGDEGLAARFRGLRPCGFRVYAPEHPTRSAPLPTPYCGDRALKQFMSFPTAGLFVTQNGAPTQYERDDTPGVAFGAVAALSVPKAAYARGLLLDREGAAALAAAGVDVGLDKAAPDGKPRLYENGRKERFAILPKSHWDLAYGEWATERVDLDAVWRFFTGAPLPVRATRAGVYVLAKERPDGGAVALVCNVRSEPTGAFTVEVGGRPRTCSLPAWGYGTVGAEEGHVAAVIAEVKASVAKLKAAQPGAVPMAFWDFDGTIIKGDIGDGLSVGGRECYRGLIEETILAGLSSVYKGREGYLQWRKDYPRLAEIGHWLSQALDAQMYAGTATAEMDGFVERTIRERGIDRWYFASSVAIWKALAEAGVENYVVSANVESVVRNVAPSLGIPRERVRAARVEVVGGRLTTRVQYPIPHGEGKVEAVRQLVRARAGGVAVAGFGNSYRTDGPFLRYIASQPLPGGAKPLSVMINGGAEPAKYKGLFRLVEQDATVGETAERYWSSPIF